MIIIEWFERWMDSVEEKVHGIESQLASTHGFFCEQTTKNQTQSNKILQQSKSIMRWKSGLFKLKTFIFQQAFSSRESGKQTPPRSPQLPINQPPPPSNNNVDNNISSSNNLSSSSLKFRSASNSSSHRASRNSSSAASTTADISSLSSSLGQLVKSALTGVAAVTASSEKINKAGNRNSVFFGLGSGSGGSNGVSRDLSRSFLPSSVLNHKSVDNLNIERFDQV